MQTVPHHRFTQHFWEKEAVSTKLPYLHREGMSRQRSPSGAHHSSRQHVLENQEGKMSSTRESQQPWQHPDNVHRKKHIHLEEQSEYVPSRRESDKLFPLKPVLHKRAYSLSNVTKPERQERLYSGLMDQTFNRPRQKAVRKLDALNTDYLGRQHPIKSDADREQRLEKQTWLSKEIHSEEMMLQEKIFKAEETLRRLQKERRDSAKRDERNKRYLEKLKEDSRFYRNGYGDRDEERDRYQGGFRDDMERWEEWERGERSKESATWRRPLTLEMRKGHKLKEMREWAEYEQTANNRSREMSNGRRERAMGWDNGRRRRMETHNLYSHSEDEDQYNVRKTNSSDSVRRDRSHLKQERRENKASLYDLTSKLKEAVPERNLSQRGKHLQQVELSLEDDPDAPHQLVPCNVCHRCFAQDRLETHMRVCERKRPQRRVFNMSQHRAKGTDLEEFMKTNPRSKTPPKKNNWRQKHEAFIQTMRQGRAHTPGSVLPQSALNLHSEYVSCPHCGRTFAPGPAERHIPKCQNIRSRPPPPKQPLSGGSSSRRKITQ